MQFSVKVMDMTGRNGAGSDSKLFKCKTPTGASCWLHVVWKLNKSICAWEYGIWGGGVDGETFT